ncbi:hypothetical protein CCR75_000032 [Bremia lactucae]|uniref:Uncharacterized protein n=1 Tax=Bremia lactucae TaxID=4779 RepID=A0A976NZI5_BRELC|nr:hypothetical protein CCR75_000032 [Bremia lactucae]
MSKAGGTFAVNFDTMFTTTKNGASETMHHYGLTKAKASVSESISAKVDDVRYFDGRQKSES